MPRYKSGITSYTADTLPDPATLGTGDMVSVMATTADAPASRNPNRSGFTDEGSHPESLPLAEASKTIAPFACGI